jgi:hypothetical protein
MRISLPATPPAAVMNQFSLRDRALGDSAPMVWWGAGAAFRKSTFLIAGDDSRAFFQ